jgi:maltose O-acetyltransferase
MGILRHVLGKTRLYRALAYAHGASMRADSARRYRPEHFARYGDGVRIDSGVHITHPSRVVIGDGTTIQSQVALHSQGGLHIGRYVGIGYRSVIVTFQHRYRNARTIPFDNGIFLQPVLIRDYAWIGWGSMILPGVEIGEGAILGMGSVATRSVPPLAIVHGNPAQVIGYRSSEHFARCKAEGRVTPHRIGELFGTFEEIIPLMTKQRCELELRELGLIE